MGEERLNELKNEIIDLVRTNTATSFPVEENTSTPAVNKKLVQELNEKEASMMKSMNKNMNYLENSLAKGKAKKEIISNFLKLKSLLNANTAASNDDKASGPEAPNVRKLSMRSVATSGSSVPRHKLVLDSEHLTRINANRVDTTVKRLNLYSSIKSPFLPKVFSILSFEV